MPSFGLEVVMIFVCSKRFKAPDLTTNAQTFSLPYANFWHKINKIPKKHLSAPPFTNSNPILP